MATLDAPALRREPAAPDVERIRELVAATGFFHPEEIEVAVELVQERLARGDASGYHFLFADRDGRASGYACYGPIACTRGSFDLYWIAVDPAFQGKGLGRGLLAAAEERIREMGGRRIYVETSSRPDYSPTRRFYAQCGYRLEAMLTDFYAPGDHKAIYVKILDAAQ